MKILNGLIVAYSLPEDAVAAEAAFIGVLNSEHETYLEMYGNTLIDLYTAIKKADSEGIVVHCLFDHTQSCGPTEKALVIDLVNSLKNGSVVITTAGPDAESKSQIAHRKRIMDVSGNTCFGSVNASHDGFHSQTNDMISFNDPDYVNAAIERFKTRREWALTNHPEYQIKP